MDEQDCEIANSDDPVVGRAITKKMARTIDISLELSTIEDLAQFFDHLARLMRLHGRIKVTIE